MINRETAGRAMLVVGGVGLAVSVVGAAVGFRAIAALEDMVTEGGVLSAQALETLEGSVALAHDTVATLEDTVTGIEGTTRDLAVAFRDGERLLEATADLSEQEIAPSVAAVQGALPGLIEAASVIDRTLAGLSALPFGPAYEPDEPFDAALRRLERELDGMPEDLVAQAELIRQTGERLGDVRAGTSAVADDLATLDESLQGAAALLDDYAAAATQAREVVAESRAVLRPSLVAGRILVAMLGLVLAAGQTIPLTAGWLLLHPDRIRTLLEIR